MTNDAAPFSIETVGTKGKAEGEAGTMIVPVLDLDELESPKTHAEVKVESQEEVVPTSTFFDETERPTNIQAEAGDETTGPNSRPPGDDEAAPNHRALRDSIGFFKPNQRYKEASTEEQLTEPLM